MEQEERVAKQALAIEERRAVGKAVPILKRDHKTCQGYGYGVAIAKFEIEVDGAVTTCLFCQIPENGNGAGKS